MAPKTQRDMTINLVTRAPLTSREEGERLLQFLCQHGPELTPQRYGNWEPLRKEFHPLRLGEALGSWEDPFLWKRTRPRFSGYIALKYPHERHGWITFTGAPTALPGERARDVLMGLAKEFLAEFALLHILHPDEFDSGYEQGAVHGLDPEWRRVNLTVPPIKLLRFLPDVYWGTIFGPAYVKLFGRDRLLATPAARVDELPYGGVCVQLTSEMSDCVKRFDRVAAARCRVKEHLNQDAFFNPQLGIDHAYAVPLADFPSPDVPQGSSSSG